ncbi:MAG: hypothetical protein WCA46_22425 [Actinocatenispora sp.]
MPMYPQTSNPLHEHRWLTVEAMEQNPQVLADYPHRYVFLCIGSTGGELTSEISRYKMVAARLFWAVESLETQGWEPAGWDLDGDSMGVIMRRVAGQSYELTGDTTQWN